VSPLREGGISRPDWAPANSSGLFHAWIIIVANRRRARRTKHGTANAPDTATAATIARLGEQEQRERAQTGH
jgi:hypothetical protein